MSGRSNVWVCRARTSMTRGPHLKRSRLDLLIDSPTCLPSSALTLLISSSVCGTEALQILPSLTFSGPGWRMEGEEGNAKGGGLELYTTEQTHTDRRTLSHMQTILCGTLLLPCVTTSGGSNRHKT